MVNKRKFYSRILPVDTYCANCGNWALSAHCVWYKKPVTPSPVFASGMAYAAICPDCKSCNLIAIDLGKAIRCEQ